MVSILTLKLPDKLQPYGLYVYYVVNICDFGMLRVKQVSDWCPQIETTLYADKSDIITDWLLTFYDCCKMFTYLE